MLRIGLPVFGKARTYRRASGGLPGNDGNELLAARWLCVELCRVYVWPIDDLDSTIEAGIAAADRLLVGEDWDSLVNAWIDDEAKNAFIAQVTGYRETLAGRRPN